jgi:hypothetical protein
MNKSTIAVIIIISLFFAIILIQFDYTNLSWNNNSVGYVKIITMFVIFFVIKLIAKKTSKKI